MPEPYRHPTAKMRDDPPAKKPEPLTAHIERFGRPMGFWAFFGFCLLAFIVAFVLALVWAIITGEPGIYVLVGVFCFCVWVIYSRASRCSACKTEVHHEATICKHCGLRLSSVTVVKWDRY